MATRSSIVRVARQLTANVAKRPAPLVGARWAPVAQTQRLFSVSATLKEKKYTEDHEWIEMSADGKTCTLGISTYAANALGEVVFIELPEVSTNVSAGDAIGAVESVKSASDILTPVSGSVAEVNSALMEKPGGINDDPEGEAWIARITIEGEPEGKMMNEEEYRAFTEDA